MAEPDSDSRGRERDGLIAHALDLFAAFWAYLHARLELAGIEGKEAAGRYVKALVLVAVAVVAAIFGYFFLCLAAAFAIAAWIGGDYAWIWVTLGASLLHLAGGAGLVFIVLGLVKEPAFELSREEFKKDQQWLKTKSAKHD